MIAVGQRLSITGRHGQCPGTIVANGGGVSVTVQRQSDGLSGFGVGFPAQGQRRIMLCRVDDLILGNGIDRQ